jgi:hypothetical protein
MPRALNIVVPTTHGAIRRVKIPSALGPPVAMRQAVTAKLVRLVVRLLASGRALKTRLYLSNA